MDNSFIPESHLIQPDDRWSGKQKKSFDTLEPACDTDLKHDVLNIQ